VVHVWEGRFYRLDAHLDRFTGSMARLRLDPGLDRAAIEAALHGCVRHAGLRAARGIMPVTVIDGKPVGTGTPGPLTRQLRDRYWASHQDPRYSTPVRYDDPA
jgi:branched-subunit amino acid aminotransferase/4-amino-4-deoxychorismate lyase